MNAVDEQGLRRSAGEMKATLENAGFPNVAIQASNITRSPYPYVYVFLTDREYDGPHLLLSERREIEDSDGWIIGRYESLDDFEEGRGGDPRTADGIFEAVEIALKLKEVVA